MYIADLTEKSAEQVLEEIIAHHKLNPALLDSFKKIEDKQIDSQFIAIRMLTIDDTDDFSIVIGLLKDDIEARALTSEFYIHRHLPRQDIVDDGFRILYVKRLQFNRPQRITSISAEIVGDIIRNDVEVAQHYVTSKVIE
jgi:hypothetical protein